MAALASASGPGPGRYEYAQPHMGTTFRIVLHASGEDEGRRAAEAAFARVAALEAALSDYRADSELMALCRRAGGPPVEVGPDLFRVLSSAQRWAERSAGAFDATAFPVVHLWRRARRIGQEPDPGELARARSLVGHAKLSLDAAAGTARLSEPGMCVDLGGIAKGFAADEAQAVLRGHGITSALVAAGGEVAVSGAPSGRTSWTVGVALPAALRDPDEPPLALRHAAVSTSGDAEQFVVLDGVRYSHIVDPRAGSPLTGRSAVAVVAPRGETADALATAVSVLGPEAGLALVEATDGAAAWIAQETPAGVRRFRSRAWPAYEAARRPGKISIARPAPGRLQSAPRAAAP
ncbi:MAG TPA: FAD:protein FMN transferase [Vicinamibacteria bacterium]|nr:FAD:protein FMN transferase [Vicinamibacteria bacterium]